MKSLLTLEKLFFLHRWTQTNYISVCLIYSECKRRRKDRSKPKPKLNFPQLKWLCYKNCTLLVNHARVLLLKKMCAFNHKVLNFLVLHPQMLFARPVKLFCRLHPAHRFHWNHYMGLLLAFFPSGIPEPIAVRGIVCCRVVTISILQAYRKEPFRRTPNWLSVVFQKRDRPSR